MHLVKHLFIRLCFSLDSHLLHFVIFNVQAFHLFHTSCLIHWILLCEVEIITNQPEAPTVKRRSRRKTVANEVQKDSELKALRTPIYSVICPECQGTGMIVEGNELEKPSVPLSKVCSLQDGFLYLIKLSYFLVQYY